MQPIPVHLDPERLRAEFDNLTPQQKVRAVAVVARGLYLEPWASWDAWPFPPRPWIADGAGRPPQVRRSKTKAYTRRHLRRKREEDARRHKEAIEAKRARRRR